MNLTYRNTLHLLSTLTVLSLSPHGTAAPVPVPAIGDVFAGFRASDGEGAAASYLVKIGSDLDFRNAPEGASFEVAGLGGIGADLAATYGANWHSRSDLHWGLFASRVSVNSTVYASRARFNGQPAATWPALGQAARNATAQTIVDVVQGLNGYAGSEATANTPAATLQVNSTSDSSYFKQVATPGTTDFGSLSQWTSIEGNFGTGATAAALDFFRIAGTGSALVGTFSIDASGVIRFTAPSATVITDSDGDGVSDADEALAGTNPADGSSLPQATLTVLANGVRIQGNAAAANQTYTLEYSPSLTAASWIPVTTHSTGAGAAVLDFVDTDAGRRAAGGFYRIRFGN